MNTIYEFDIESKKILQVLPLVEVVSWQENISSSPFALTIKYIQFNVGEQKGDLNFAEEEKELVLYTNYETEISKWTLALKICFKRYSLSIKR